MGHMIGGALPARPSDVDDAVWDALVTALALQHRVALELRSGAPFAPVVVGTPRLFETPEGVTRVVLGAPGVEYIVDVRTIARVDRAD